MVSPTFLCDMVLLQFCQSSRYGSPSSLGTAVLTEEELDWLQTGVVTPFAPPQKKGRSPVSWRQAMRREHRLEHKLYPLHCPPHSAQPCTGTCRFSGVSGLLCPRRSKWFLVHRNHGVTPASRPSTGPMNVADASASHALVQVSPGTNLLVERRFMKRMARRRKPAVSGCPVPEVAASAERLGHERQHVLVCLSAVGEYYRRACRPCCPPSTSAGSESRKRIKRKRSLGMSLAPEVTAETCEERYIGRQEAFDELHGAVTLKSILQNESGSVSGGAQS